MRSRPSRARCRQAVEFFDFRKADVDLRPAGLLQPVQHRRQAVQGLRAEHQVDERRPRGDALALLARHAAAHPDDHMRALLLEQPPFAEQGEDLFLRLFAHGTGIDQQHVRLGGIVGARHAMGGFEHVPHLAGIVLVHLAAERFYV